MTGKKYLDSATDFRDLVLLIEIGGWLHDLGKLSRYFVEGHFPENQSSKKSGDFLKWVHGEVIEYDKDSIPTDIYSILHQNLVKKKIEKDKENKGLLEINGNPPLLSDQTSLAGLIKKHHDSKLDLYIEKLLKAADGIESSEDENSAIKAQGKDGLARTTVFGYETPFCLENLDISRKSVYFILEIFLKDPANFYIYRDKLWAELQTVLSLGLGKTQKAAHDVRLDQHVWGVSSRLKAFVMRDLITSKEGISPNSDNKNFRILSVVWDAWKLTTPFARLPDVTARFGLIGQVKEKIRYFIENEVALGNRVYHDDNGIHFLIADLDCEDELAVEIRRIVNQETEGEIQPVIHLSSSTKWITSIVDEIHKARNKMPLVRQPEWVNKWKTSGDNEGKWKNAKICPVCHLRPLEGSEDKEEICDFCIKIRKTKSIKPQGTVWNGEIADQNGCVALLMFRFNLEEWLNGKMLYTTFISSTQDLKNKFYLIEDEKSEINSLAVEQTKSNLLEIHSWSQLPEFDLIKQYFDYSNQHKNAKEKLDESNKSGGSKESDKKFRHELHSKIQELKKELNELEKSSDFQFSKFANHIGGSGKIEHLKKTIGFVQQQFQLSERNAYFLALARKNPTAGRLLRIWQTTEEFFDEVNTMISLNENVKDCDRLKFTLKDWLKSQIYSIEFPILGRLEVFIDQSGNCQSIELLDQRKLGEYIKYYKKNETAESRKIKIISAENKENKEVGRIVEVETVEIENYRPFRIITTSPNLMLALVPADKAPEISRQVYKKYTEYFGKVQGRLPLQNALIFMDAHYPMFAALDTARRLGESYDRMIENLQQARIEKVEEGDGFRKITLTSERFGSWAWTFPLRNLDSEMDYYHPYLILKETETSKDRRFSLMGPYGHCVHVSAVEVGDEILFQPNLFDFIYLDTISRRLDAHTIGSENRRPHAVLGEKAGTLPMLFERLEDFTAVWEELGKTINTNTQLNAVESLLIRKKIFWQTQNPAMNQEQQAEGAFSWLVEQVITQDLGGSEDLEKAIHNGMIFDVLEFYKHILKKDITQVVQKSNERN